jgi:hypothetical protein
MQQGPIMMSVRGDVKCPSLSYGGVMRDEWGAKRPRTRTKEVPLPPHSIISFPDNVGYEVVSSLGFEERGGFVC